MTALELGCIDIWIDEIVPCLKDTVTGDIKETVVFKIESHTYLKKIQKSNGWHIGWNEIPKNVEVYAVLIVISKILHLYYRNRIPFLICTVPTKKIDVNVKLSSPVLPFLRYIFSE